MSLEQKIEALIAAVEANTAALSGSKPASTSTGDGGEGKPGRGKKGAATEEKTATTKYTAEQVKAAAVKVKGELGTKKAKQIIADHGAEELAALKPEKYESFIKACEKALKGDEDEDGGDGDL